MFFLVLFVQHVVVQCLFVVVLSGAGGVGGHVWMWWVRHTRASNLTPSLKDEGGGEASPNALAPEAQGEALEKNQKPHQRYTKAQARQRYRKGKT